MALHVITVVRACFWGNNFDYSVIMGMICHIILSNEGQCGYCH